MLHPLRTLKAALNRWWLSRLALTDTQVLNQRNVYILPTRAGLMLALTLLVLLVASINYQLNLGYLLTFLLAGCAVVAIHISHANLTGISLHLLPPEPVYAGANAHFVIELQNPGKRPRYALAASRQGAQQWVWSNLGAQGTARLSLGVETRRRGLQNLPPLVLQTLFPLGTFRVWTLWRPAAQLWVYPAPELHPPPLPGSNADADPIAAGVRSNSSEPDGVRAYRRGDALRQIVWKKAAKTGELVSRDQSAQQSRRLWLSAQQTELHDPEARLRRLCAWVLMAHQSGCDYGLRLGAQEIAPDHGTQHQQRCLQALALA
jgi:uncharacterized protein (DUF58 family)